MSEFDFSVTRDGAIARVDLNRPGEGNALTRAMMPTWRRSMPARCSLWYVPEHAMAISIGPD